MFKDKVKCPKCGVSHYYERYQTATAIGYYCEYVDGVLQPTFDPNTYTHYCTCCECGTNFYYTHCRDKFEVHLDYIDEKPLNLTFRWNANEMYEYKKKQLKEQIASLQKELEELEFNGKYLGDKIKLGSNQSCATNRE